MDLPLPEHRRVKLTTGTITPTSTKTTAFKTSPKADSAQLQNLGTARPFTRQLDVIFPSSDRASDETDALLTKLGVTRYIVGQVKLADIIDSAAGLPEDCFGNPAKWLTMLSVNEHSDDVWCIDPRGILTLHVAKDTYERLGLVGKKLPFKGQTEYFVVRLPLRKNADSVANQARKFKALKSWDERREREGLGAWNVLCSSSDDLPEAISSMMKQTRDVECQVTHISDVRIPIPSSLRSHLSRDDDAHEPRHSQQTRASDGDGHEGADDGENQSTLEDYHAKMAGLFEWVGMACLGSQRLQANDRVDPYIAVYEPPAPSHLGNVTHLRWTGFISHIFLQSVIDTAVALIQKTHEGTDHPTPAANRGFIALTAHAHSASPVTYIPPSSTSINGGPVRLARSDGEDTWSLIAIPASTSVDGNTDNASSIEWALVESLGQYDTRWG